MSDFAGRFGDKRRAAALARLEAEMISQSSVVIRRLGKDRGGEMSYHRALSASEVTAAEIVECLSGRAGRVAAGRRIVVAQDTTEVNFPGDSRKRLGPAGRTGKTAGFFLHAAVAVEADEETVLGVVDAAIWTRDGQAKTARRSAGCARPV
jgi:hypothetical protein